jgi:membrane fusion protein (multidrug efflux system)
MSRKAIFWLILGGLFVLTLALLAFKLYGKRSEADQPPVAVEVQNVSKGDIEQLVLVTGMVEARAVVHVMPKVSGRLESLAVKGDGGKAVRVEEGLTVRKDQQIGQIDRDLYQAAASQAEAQAAAARAEAADAEREKKRMTSLFDGGSVTAQMRDKAATAAEMAQARLKAAQATQELSAINLRESVLRSPMDGVVTKRHIDEGNLVGVGQPVVSIADVAEMKVIVSISEKYAGMIREGLPCRLMVDAYPGKVFSASVKSVYPALDAGTRSLQAEIRLDNAGMELKPGMFARVELVAAQKKDVVVIGKDAVMGGKVSEAFVYVVKDNTAHKKLVERGVIQGDMVEITSGLDEGEQLVVNGMTYLKENIKVEVVSMEAVK